MHFPLKMICLIVHPVDWRWEARLRWDENKIERRTLAQNHITSFLFKSLSPSSLYLFQYLYVWPMETPFCTSNNCSQSAHGLPNQEHCYTQQTSNMCLLPLATSFHYLAAIWMHHPSLISTFSLRLRHYTICDKTFIPTNNQLSCLFLQLNASSTRRRERNNYS